MKPYLIPIYIILEYLLILRNKIIYVYRPKPPTKWSVGDKGDIVLIQGLHEGWTFLQTIGDHLNKVGFKIHVISGLGTNTISVNNGCEIISKYVASHKLKWFTIITHSKGGIEALYLLKDPNVSRNINKVITLACPYSGTKLAHVFPSSQELLPSSNLIKDCLQDVDLEKIYNIYPSVDNHIIPNKSLILKHGKNFQIDIVGHTRILEARATIMQIVNVLN